MRAGLIRFSYRAAPENGMMEMSRHGCFNILQRKVLLVIFYQLFLKIIYLKFMGSGLKTSGFYFYL